MHVHITQTIRVCSSLFGLTVKGCTRTSSILTLISSTSSLLRARLLLNQRCFVDKSAQRRKHMVTGSKWLVALFAHFRVTKLCVNSWGIARSWHGRRGVYFKLLSFKTPTLFESTDLDWCYSYQLIADLAADWKAVPDRRNWLWIGYWCLYGSHMH